MKLLEFEGKNLFQKYKIPIAAGVVVSSASEDAIAEVLQKVASPECVVKAQVLSGKRGMAGGIKIVQNSADSVAKACRTLLGSQLNMESINKLLVEEKLDIQEESYLAITIDCFNKNYVLLYSKTGGINVEDETNKSLVKKLNFFELKLDELQKIIPDLGVCAIALKLWELVKTEKCILAEINPLVQTKKGKYIAADSKIIIDDNALKLLPEKIDLNYVELDGNIGIIGNGAGLVMATLDAIAHFGGKPACFLDVGGGANSDIVQKSIKKALSNKKVSTLFINIFAGITQCNEIASGIINAVPKNIPVVVRIAGTNEQIGRSMLEKAGINVVDTMEMGIKKAIEAGNGNNH